MEYKRIKPVQALFNQDNKLVVIDENGVVWIETNNHSDWERYHLLPDVKRAPNIQDVVDD